MRLAAIEIDPFVGTEFQTGIIKTEFDTTLQTMKGNLSRDLVRGDHSSCRDDETHRFE